MNQSDLVKVNKTLAERYGKSIDGRSYFRLVWSEDELEKREGIFLEEHPIIDDKGRLIVIESEVEGVKETYKYMYIWDKFILEELRFEDIPAEIKNNQKGSYEPLYVFQDKFYEPVEPTMDAIDMLIYYRLNGNLKGHKPTEAELIKHRRDQFKEEIDEAIPSGVVNQLVKGHAVFLDTSKQKEKVNGS
jgi:hypothetical protein